MINRADNKIRIPWYRRNVAPITQINVEPLQMDLEFPEIEPRTKPKPKRLKKPKPATQPAAQPARQPLTQPARQPVTQPATQPSRQPLPRLQKPPVVMPPPFPIPGKIPTPTPAPTLKPALRLVAKPVAKFVAAKTAAIAAGFAATVTGVITAPVIVPVAAVLAALITVRGITQEGVAFAVDDTTYEQMLKEPYIGVALREAEKANMNTEVISTIFANFDWANGNYDDLRTALTITVGAAGTARLFSFIPRRGF